MHLGRTNPLCGKVLAYLAEDPGGPIVFFHLWNGSGSDRHGAHTLDRVEPDLPAVRFGNDPFSETFTFTPEGRCRQPEGPGSSFEA